MAKYYRRIVDRYGKTLVAGSEYCYENITTKQSHINWVNKVADSSLQYIRSLLPYRINTKPLAFPYRVEVVKKRYKKNGKHIKKVVYQRIIGFKE